METLDEKNKSTEVSNGIKEERLKALKGKWQKPVINYLKCTENTDGECSDMASHCGRGSKD